MLPELKLVAGKENVNARNLVPKRRRTASALRVVLASASVRDPRNVRLSVKLPNEK